MIPMSNESSFTTPIETVFELQRNVIKQSQEAVGRSVEFQRRLNTMAIDGMGGTETAQRSTVELAESGIHSYLDAV